MRYLNLYPNFVVVFYSYVILRTKSMREWTPPLRICSTELRIPLIDTGFARKRHIYHDTFECARS